MHDFMVFCQLVLGNNLTGFGFVFYVFVNNIICLLTYSAVLIRNLLSSYLIRCFLYKLLFVN